MLSEFYGRLTARQIIIATLVIGLIARIVVGVFYKYPIEDNYWILASTNFTAGEGLYGLPGYYYLPLWGYILVMITALANALGIPYGHYMEDFGGAVKDCDVVIPSMEYSLLVMAVLIVFDILVSYAIYRIGQRVTGDDKKAAIMAAVWFLCPMTIAMSCIRLMFENVEVLLLLISLLLMMDRRPFFSGLAMGACILSKQFGLFAAIIMIGYAYAQSKDVRYTLGYIIGVVIAALVLMAPVILAGELETSMHWLTSRVDSGTAVSTFNAMIYIAPIIAVMTLAMTVWIARSGCQDIPIISLMMVLPVAIMLIIAGNVQYYLFLLPFMALAWSRIMYAPFAALTVLAFMSLTTFISQCSMMYIEFGLPLSDAIASIADFFAPFEVTSFYYESSKYITGVIATGAVGIALYLRWRNYEVSG